MNASSLTFKKYHYAKELAFNFYSDQTLVKKNTGDKECLQINEMMLATVSVKLLLSIQGEIATESWRKRFLSR